MLDRPRALGIYVAVEQLVGIDIGSFDLPGARLLVAEFLRLGIRARDLRVRCVQLKVDVNEDAAGLLIAPIPAAVDEVMSLPHLALMESMRVALRHRSMLRGHPPVIMSVISVVVVGERRRSARKGQYGGENGDLHDGVLPDSACSETDSHHSKTL